jgi:hypothetical protein
MLHSSQRGNGRAAAAGVRGALAQRDDPEGVRRLQRARLRTCSLTRASAMCLVLPSQGTVAHPSPQQSAGPTLTEFKDLSRQPGNPAAGDTKQFIPSWHWAPRPVWNNVHDHG